MLKQTAGQKFGDLHDGRELSKAEYLLLREEAVEAVAPIFEEEHQILENSSYKSE